MKIKFSITAITALLILTFAPFASAQDGDKAAIDKFISAQATREQAEEYAEARKVVTGDLNGDRVPETVVLYTIEGQQGSNNHIQYLAVFTRANGQLVPLTHTSTGSKSYRDVQLDSISSGLINLTTMSYAKNDPSCCPTLKGNAWYKLTLGRLVAVKAGVKRSQ
jgi:hypothetical protein